MVTLLPITIAVLGTARLVQSGVHHRRHRELLAAQIHSGIVADIIRNPGTDPAWSTTFDPWIKPGEDARYFTLQRWLEFFRRGWRAGVFTRRQLEVNAANLMQLEGGSLLWALTRDGRLKHSSGSRSGRRFWHLINEAFLAVGGETVHAEVIRDVRGRALARPPTRRQAAPRGRQHAAGEGPGAHAPLGDS